MLNVGIRSELDHYACMVDLLGCAGWLEEAEHLIISMPIIPDIAVWDALHGACRVHANAEMGRTVGNLLIQSDKIHDGRNVLLSNIYTEFIKGEDGEEVRTMRKKKNKAFQGVV
uniref:Pentatricopeptide repeat-containing protein n=1 Tax=Cannabis sativa TaxID=3483 RepID=A0A803P361_CANSA